MSPVAGVEFLVESRAVEMNYASTGLDSQPDDSSTALLSLVADRKRRVNARIAISVVPNVLQ